MVSHDTRKDKWIEFFLTQKKMGVGKVLRYTIIQK